MTLRFLLVFAFSVLAFSAFAADGNTEVDVAVLRSDVARGEVIAEADVEYKAIPQMRANASIVRAITDVAGMEARRALKAGELIRTNDLKRPDAGRQRVHRDDAVRSARHALVRGRARACRRCGRRHDHDPQSDVVPESGSRGDQGRNRASGHARFPRGIRPI